MSQSVLEMFLAETNTPRHTRELILVVSLDNIQVAWYDRDYQLRKQDVVHLPADLVTLLAARGTISIVNIPETIEKEVGLR